MEKGNSVDLVLQNKVPAKLCSSGLVWWEILGKAGFSHQICAINWILEIQTCAINIDKFSILEEVAILPRSGKLKRQQVSLAPEALLVQIFCKKCLHPLLLKMTCLWRPSAWLSVRLWLARVKPSLSPSLLAPPSASPWTPRSQHLCQRRRRSPVLQLWDEMLWEERSSWKGKLKLLQLRRLQIQSNAHLSSPTHLCHFLQWKLSWSPSSVTNVMTDL